MVNGLGMMGVPWCGIFASFCYYMAGKRLGNIGYLKGFAGCQTAVAHFRKTGEVTNAPVSGDLVFFDWQNDGKFDHVGIFDKWKDDSGYFLIIEGNTAIGNDSNGGEVMYRIRAINKDYTVLFVHPKVNI
jgi:hypothetical protein